MGNSEKREYLRFLTGGSAEISFDDTYFTGEVINTSMGGIFLEFKGICMQINRGEKVSVRILDIFSEKKCAFSSEVIRVSGGKVAFKFLSPLNDYQQLFLQQWFLMTANPMSDSKR
jgi:hypothetical protein